MTTRRKTRSGSPRGPRGGKKRGARPGIFRRLLFPAAVIALLGVLLGEIASSALGRGRARAFGKTSEIAIDGALVPVGVPVIRWTDPQGFSAYEKHCHDRPERILASHPAPGADTPERISVRKGEGPLGERISQFVIHFDESWTSRNCFHVLQDVRGLSVHFMCDLDGTIYQTCDVRERARHATYANDRSVGVEVAHPGVLEDSRTLAEHYKRDARGVYLELPAWLGPHPVRTAGFVPRPARPEPIRGRVQGRDLTQWDFTDEQYDALAHLAAALSRSLPRIRLEVPRDAEGRVRDRAFPSPGAAAEFEGVLGHYHLQTNKSDPGPAFDWDRFLAGARRLR
jgi:N-acetyl-anhydromuramyl-L-alanine amidase AmpD